MFKKKVSILFLLSLSLVFGGCSQNQKENKDLTTSDFNLQNTPKLYTENDIFEFFHNNDDLSIHYFNDNKLYISLNTFDNLASTSFKTESINYINIETKKMDIIYQYEPNENIRVRDFRVVGNDLYTIEISDSWAYQINKRTLDGKTILSEASASYIFDIPVFVSSNNDIFWLQPNYLEESTIIELYMFDTVYNELSIIFETSLSSIPDNIPFSATDLKIIDSLLYFYTPTNNKDESQLVLYDISSGDFEIKNFDFQISRITVTSNHFIVETIVDESVEYLIKDKNSGEERIVSSYPNRLANNKDGSESFFVHGDNLLVYQILEFDNDYYWGALTEYDNNPSSLIPDVLWDNNVLLIIKHIEGGIKVQELMKS